MPKLYPMKITDFDFTLPEHLIAQTPIPVRSNSRLMVVNRKTNTIYHHHFSELPALLEKNRLLVFNDTKVIPARLKGKRASGGAVEVLLSHVHAKKEWFALLNPASRLKEGELITISKALQVKIKKKNVSQGLHLIALQYDTALAPLLDAVGHVPLPPYISAENIEKETLKQRYQTVFAKHAGAIAAPTAGLHFTPELLASLKKSGVEQTSITLHVGVGTFTPIKTQNVTDHSMHPEWYDITKASAQKITTYAAKGAVIAVGTTVVRTLESAFTDQKLSEGASWSDKFIYPGYQFNCIGGLITNFHLPRSSLLLLVSAFAGKSLIRKAYAEAIAKEYKFYSFGDAMLIL